MISIVTVCHNSSELLNGYVESFLAHHVAAENPLIEFILVENSGDQSTYDHARRLREAGFAAEVVEMANLGFGAGCNLGVARARGEVLVFANPDIRFLSAIGAIDAFFGAHGWGTVLQRGDGGREYCFDLLPEYRGLLSEGLKVHNYLHRIRALRRLCYPVGSFFIVRKDLFSRAGGFDERFFLYFEEAELSRRLRAIAGSPGLVPTVAIWHKGLGTQPSTDFTLREEVRGFVTYCRITGQPGLLRRRVRVLRLLSRWSAMAGKRADLLDAAGRAGAVA